MPSTLLLTLESRKISDGITEKKSVHPVNIPNVIKVGDAKYQISGIVVHHGDEISNGHFTVFLMKSDTWWHINDHRCFKVKDHKAMLDAVRGGASLTGYILKYRKL